MIARNAKQKIITALKRSPAVALLGARQVGKTTLALDISGSISSVYLDIENRLDLQKVRDIEAFHPANGNNLIILDEVQRLPRVFSALRGIIDKERREGRKIRKFSALTCIWDCVNCSAKYGRSPIRPPAISSAPFVCSAPNRC